MKSIEKEMLNEKAPAIEVHGTTSASTDSSALPVGVAPSGAAPPGGQRTIADFAERTFSELIAKRWSSRFGGGLAATPDEKNGIECEKLDAGTGPAVQVHAPPSAPRWSASGASATAPPGGRFSKVDLSGAAFKELMAKALSSAVRATGSESS